jgi:hypothetical protein
LKKSLLAFVLVFVMLTGFTGVVAAAPAQAGGTVKLISALHISGAGVMFTFEVSGDFSLADLQGSVKLPDGRTFELYCNQVDEITVKCSVTKAVAEQNVTVSFGGQQFPAFVRLRENCYSVWAWYDFTGNQWTDFGPYCQDSTPKQYDTITFTVPDPNGSYDGWAGFYYEDVSTYCPDPVPYNGPAYYFPFCPNIP